MKPAWRGVILAALLGASVAAAVWVTEAENAAPATLTNSAPVADSKPRAAAPRDAQINRSPTAAVSADAPPALALERLQRATLPTVEHNPFLAKSWFIAPAPVAAVAPAPPPAPTAPALPFTYAGKFQDDSGRWIIYLAKGEQSFAIGKGETFDNQYRLDEIEENQLAIRYLPLSILQTLPIAREPG